VNFLKGIFKQIPGRWVLSILWIILSSFAIAVFIASIFYSIGFGLQFLVVAIPIFLLAAIISWLLFQYRSVKTYTFGNTCIEYVLNSDGTAIHTTHLEIRPNQQATDGLLVKGKFDDLPGWSDPVISHDGDLFGSCLDKNYPRRYLIWLTSLPSSRQTHVCSITREYTNSTEKPDSYVSWLVRRKRQSITLFVAIHKDFLFDKDKVVFVTSPKNKCDISIPLSVEACSLNNNCNYNKQIDNDNYYTFKYTVTNPQSGCKYSIKWIWDV